MMQDSRLLDLHSELHRDIVFLLSQNDDWKKIAGYFDLSEDEVYNYNTQNPAEILLDKLQRRLCSVSLFCEALEACQLYSSLILLKGPEPLVIQQQPVANGIGNVLMIKKGGVLKLTCTATGLPPPTYQWFCCGIELIDQTGSCLTIDNFDVSHEGEYICELSQEGSDSVLSNPVSVSLVPEPPVILSQLPPQETCRIRSTLFLMVEAVGHPQLRYQWYQDNKLIDGAVENNLVISNIDVDNEGLYRCYISNESGEIWSNPCKVSVYAAPEDVDKNSRPTATAKIALLIANQEYEHMNNLKSPVSDVLTLGYIFRELGFEVIALQDLSLIEMKNAIKYFSEVVPEGAYVVFYFAGHGFQIRDKFMLPVDAPSPETYLQTDALCERELLRLVLAKNPKVFVELLDMCLKMPDPANKKVFEESSDLQEYHANNNLIQGYATTSYMSAFERKKDCNGLYVKHLSEYLSDDESIVKILDQVAKAIENEETSEVQFPYRGTNVTREFRFTDACAEHPDVKEQIQRISKVRSNFQLKFENTCIEAFISFSPYRDLFLNFLEVKIQNLKDCILKCCQTDAEHLTLDLVRIKELRILRVKNIQKFKYDKSVSLQLFSKEDELIGHAVLDLGKPMIAALDLWCEQQNHH